LRQRAWCSGQAMFAVQLGEPSQVGGSGVAVLVTSPVTPTGTVISQPSPGPTVVTPLPNPITIPITGDPTSTPPIIRRSLGAKTGVNLLGDLETWALPDAQKVTQASLTFNGVSVKELRDLCM